MRPGPGLAHLGRKAWAAEVRRRSAEPGGILPRGDRARWGASGALNPQPALAGPMLAFGPPVRDRPGNGASKAGSRATSTCEPRQDRKVAAVSGPWWVPRGRLTGATSPDAAESSAVNGGL